MTTTTPTIQTPAEKGGSFAAGLQQSMVTCCSCGHRFVDLFGRKMCPDCFNTAAAKGKLYRNPAPNIHAAAPAMLEVLRRFTDLCEEHFPDPIGLDLTRVYEDALKAIRVAEGGAA